MKPALFIALLFATGVCMGQAQTDPVSQAQIDSALKRAVYLPLVMTHVNAGTKWTITSRHANPPTTYDTIWVIMLCGNIDQHRDLGLMECIGDSCHSLYDTTLLPQVWQMKGYEVREVIPEPWRESSKDVYYEHVAYLDADKRPLSKNIIVWMSKEIRP